MSLWSLDSYCDSCDDWERHAYFRRLRYIRDYWADDIKQYEELPGIDIKNRLGPTKSWHNRLTMSLNTAEGESRFRGSGKKKLSKKSNIHRHQNSQDVAFYLISPIRDITCGQYIKNNLNKELVKDIKNPALILDEHDGVGNTDENLPAKLAARPSVIALNLKWKRRVTLTQSYTTSNIKETQLEPLIKKTEFNYETKTKFGKEVESVCEELFPDWRRNLIILDGNDCYEGLAVGSVGTKIARSDRLMEEDSPFPSHEPDPFCRRWREWRDLEEHKILVIPSHSRSGFGRDLIRYQLLFQVQFVIERRTYHHKFMLELPVTRAPQHYGLIFKFSEDPMGYAKFRVKSLFSVYCIFPVSPKRAYLKTYEMDPDLNDYINNMWGVAGKEAIAAVKLLTNNLKEYKLTTGYRMRFGIDRELARPAQDYTTVRRHCRRDTDYKKLKQKKKKEILRNIKMEQLVLLGLM